MKQDADGTTSKPRLLVAPVTRNGYTQDVYRPSDSNLGATRGGNLIILGDDDMQADWATCRAVGGYLGQLRRRLARTRREDDAVNALRHHEPAWSYRQAVHLVRCLAGLEEGKS
jgi:hypothetical protein